VFFLIDIDHFKRINDEHGHAAGDAVLMQVAERLRACFRDTDHLVRWGGEEFLVVSRGIERRLAASLAERAVRAVGGYAFELPDRRRLRRSCSLGYAVFPLDPRHPPGLDWAASIELADLALYAAKRAGRDGWVGFDGGAGGPLTAGWLGDLVGAIDGGRLHLASSLPAEAVRRALAEGPS
jgi:diguanylate cyclase (GGDEF)-like protein